MNSLLLATFILQAASGSIQGVVVRGTEVPEATLENARVELDGGQAGTFVIRTNALGEFVFGSLPAGNYRLSVKRDGYVRQQYGEREVGGIGTILPIAAGSPIRGLVFRLKPTPTISGRVQNEYGYPVANILIQAMRRSYDVRGNRTVTVFSNGLTDDRGEYRLYWLDQGTYYVNASYLPKLPTAVNANEDAPRAVYASTYFPGDTDPANAQPIDLPADGEVGNINFRLDRSPAVTVRGTTYSVAARRSFPARVTLSNPDASGSASRYSVETDENGSFEMKNIVSGTYIVSARSLFADGQLGFSTITVEDKDYDKAEVLLGFGMQIDGRFFVETAATLDLSAAAVTLLPIESVVPSPEPAMVQPNGTFSVAAVQPGTHMLRVTGLPDGIYVKTARYAERDALAELIQARYDTAGPLNIVLGLDGGQLTGSALDDSGKPAPRASIVLVPDNTRRHRPDPYRVAVSEQNGAFALRGIPPGEYKLFAWGSIEKNAYLNADFIAPFEAAGLTVQIGPGEKLTASIRILPK
jgi:hypothetical protein